ncbi:Protein of unknown function [Pyronema omphalodes CBS 100304]|uniref:Uncharacterized protein n=1 Tax=Pyronema omphalodes (strain CBS 100304) TaxID=1076935 RepID=U4LWT8_PYROM|nr:Protein of unknown function [Pyronema omphalodes CBS 100304]
MKQLTISPSLEPNTSSLWTTLVSGTLSLGYRLPTGLAWFLLKYHDE